MGEGRGNDHDQLGVSDGGRDVRGQHIQRLMGRYAFQSQLDPSVFLQILQILGEQVTQIDFGALTGQIRGNGTAAVSGADDGNRFVHGNCLLSIKKDVGSHTDSRKSSAAGMPRRSLVLKRSVALLHLEVLHPEQEEDD